MRKEQSKFEGYVGGDLDMLLNNSLLLFCNSYKTEGSNCRLSEW